MRIRIVFEQRSILDEVGVEEPEPGLVFVGIQMEDGSMLPEGDYDRVGEWMADGDYEALELDVNTAEEA